MNHQADRTLIILQHHQGRRATVVVAAVLAAIVVWLLTTQVAGVEVRSPEMGGEPPADITVVQVLSASLVASAAGWALLAALERFTSNARRTWLITAVAALAVSFVPPLTGSGISTSSQVALALLHVVVAGVLIPGLLATASEASTSGSGARPASRGPQPDASA